MASPAAPVASIASMPSAGSRFAAAFPNSRKVHVEGESGRVRVPMREIALSGGEPPLRVYDTSGPHDADVRAGPGYKAKFRLVHCAWEQVLCQQKGWVRGVGQGHP